MQALRAALTPLAKKQKTADEIELSSDEEDDTVEEKFPEKFPDWANRQESLLQQILSRLTTIEDSFHDMQTEISQAKFQAGVAQSLAEEAMDKVEKMNDEMNEKMKNIEENMITKSQVQNMIDSSLQQLKGNTGPFVSVQHQKGKPITFQNDGRNAHADEKFSRTAVIGGFPRDTDRNEIIKFINTNIVKETDPNIDELFAYKFGSIGFVRFQTTSQMWDFITKQNDKPKPKFDGKEVWSAVSKSPSERKAEV